MTMNVYKKKPGHAKQRAGSSDLASFFDWALKLCRRDDTDRVMVETPDWRITWDAPKKRGAVKKTAKKPAKRKTP